MNSPALNRTPTTPTSLPGPPAVDSDSISEPSPARPAPGPGASAFASAPAPAAGPASGASAPAPAGAQPAADVVDASEIPAGLPPGPLTTAELARAVPQTAGRAYYRRIWHGMYRRADQVDDLELRSRTLARIWPEGVLRGRSAALLWGDDSVPEDALPEIWLPRTRKSRDGRIYRYGSMPASAVTQVDGLRVTTPLRTCRDLAGDLPFDDAVVAVERLCAAVSELPALLVAVSEHPSGRGGREFVQVAGAADPRSGSIASTRARLALAAAGCGEFRHGYTIRLGKRTLELPLADPDSRCVVLTAGGMPTPKGWADPRRSRMQLRKAGWTVIVVRGPATSPCDAPAPADAAAPAAAAPTAAAPAAVEGTVSARAAVVLRARWSRTDVYPPVRSGPADDPLGIWSPITR